MKGIVTRVVLLTGLFLGIGIGGLFGLNYFLGWNLDVFVTHAGFFQAWIGILQAIVVIATLIYVGLEASEAQRSISTNTVQRVVDSHIEILSKILDYPKLHDAILGDEIISDPRSLVYISMFLNYWFNVYTLREQGYIDDDWWAPIVRDMRDTLGSAPVRKRWNEVKELYPSRYQKFIENVICSNR
jgi:hypothetical protein